VTILLYSLVCLIWGSTWLAIKFGLEGVPPFLGAGLRFAAAAAVLWGLAWAAGLSRRPSPNGAKAIAVSGLLGFGASYALVYWSETRIASGVVASFYALMPLAVALMTAFVTRTESLTTAKSVGILAGVAGVGLIFWPERGVAGADRAGLAAALLSALLSAVNLVAQSVWSKKDDARVLNAWSMSIGAVILLFLSAAFERDASVAWTPANVGAIAYLAVAGSVVAFLTYYELLRRLPATKVSMITLIFPVVALFLGRIVLGETIGARAGAGVLLILGGVGVALATQAAANRRKAKSPA
jgi:drug/metabolite transporter (DMT)-like permease